MRFKRPPAPPVSIHAPLAGRDLKLPPSRLLESSFQSTRPSRGATSLKVADFRRPRGFNPRAPRGARPLLPSNLPQGAPVSIHAPLAGRDPTRGCGAGRSPRFNPRAPRGARRGTQQRRRRRSSVSIHAPLAGRDISRAAGVGDIQVFQSTRPSRGATV